MNPRRPLFELSQRLVCVLLAFLPSGLIATVQAGRGDNPYRSISARNAFQLAQMAPRLPAAYAPPPARPAPQIRLTGLTNVGGRKRALIEILTEGQGVRKLVVMEGEKLGEVEILGIDVQATRLTLRCADRETDLTFEPNGPGVGKASAVLPLGPLRP